MDSTLRCPHDRLLERRGGELLKIAKALKESLVIADYAGNLRLLQHDFRQPDPIGVGGLLPGQVVTPMAFLPVDQGYGEG